MHCSKNRRASEINAGSKGNEIRILIWPVRACFVIGVTSCLKCKEAKMIGENCCKPAAIKGERSG